ncbi:DUF2252 family protein [Edaphobacter modestus]|uniref:DUF2252 family protein n=1 Tax=Edaphobacter modestus TaxID=388466 RepID=UPI002414FAFF|nr:DUF2252 family protein [Edaphobacter modestus]
MNPLIKIDPKSQAVFSKALTKALATDNKALVPKVAERRNGGSWMFPDDPPVLTRGNASTRAKVIDALNRYSDTLPGERRFMLCRYHVADVAHRVVGVGSVGSRAYLALLFGNGDNDPLFLQVKEAAAPAHAPTCRNSRKSFSTMASGWCWDRKDCKPRTIQAGLYRLDGRHYYVRQMKNLKASIPVEWLTGASFNFYAWACGALLARAHARVGDAARIAGYCGNSAVLDRALAEWAESYGDQTEQDHATLADSIKRGKTKPHVESGNES